MLKLIVHMLFSPNSEQHEGRDYVLFNSRSPVPITEEIFLCNDNVLLKDFIYHIVVGDDKANLKFFD